MQNLRMNLTILNGKTSLEFIWPENNALSIATISDGKIYLNGYPASSIDLPKQVWNLCVKANLFIDTEIAHEIE